MKIALVICYFGKFPWYFELFLKSCETNPDIDFFIFTDINYPKKLPNNVKMVNLDFPGLRDLISSKLGFEVALESPYKLCDFKPTYGVVFSEYLEGYDFWGMYDIDIVLGRVREFMTEELLNEYDVLSVRDDYPTGNFMLFRNIDKINQLFTKSKDYKKVFTAKAHYCFDECNFQNAALSYGMDITELSCEIESMHHVITAESKNGNIKAFFDFFVIEGLPGKMIWTNGELTFQDEYEILLHHLIVYKDNIYTRKERWEEIPNQFFIDRYNIRKKSTSTLSGLLEYLWFEKLYPLKNMFLHLTDYYLSLLLGSKKLPFLKTGSYQIGLFSFHVQQSSAGYKEFLHDKESGFNFPLIQSYFYPNSFLSKGSRPFKYRVEKEGEVIRRVYYDGNSTLFKRQ